MRLPIFGRSRAAAPCAVAWSDMTGDDRVRFCGACASSVYHLAAMPAHEVDDFVAAHSGDDACLNLYRRADGTVRTRDCPVGLRRRRQRTAVVVAVSSALLAALSGLGARRAPPPEVLPESVTISPDRPAWFAPEHDAPSPQGIPLSPLDRRGRRMTDREPVAPVKLAPRRTPQPSGRPTFGSF